MSGPDGVAAVGVGEVWVGDGDSSVKVIDVTTMKVVQTISSATIAARALRMVARRVPASTPSSHYKRGGSKTKALRHRARERQLTGWVTPPNQNPNPLQNLTNRTIMSVSS